MSRSADATHTHAQLMKAFEDINADPVYIDEPVVYLLQPLSSNYYHAVIEATVRCVKYDAIHTFMEIVLSQLFS